MKFGLQQGVRQEHFANVHTKSKQGRRPGCLYTIILLAKITERSSHSQKASCKSCPEQDVYYMRLLGRMAT